jgi:hypothetical protein
MNIREISKPVTAASLNESLAKRFGQRINLGKFTIEQLQDVRNKVRTTLSQVETNESFNSVQKEAYQKSKLFLDVLNAEISERGDIDEAKKPDADGDGVPDWADKKPGKDDNAGKGKKGGKPKKGVVPPQFKKKNESIVKEGAEEAAELVMAAKDMVDRITGWMEDTAEMQTESMLELADSIRDEMGSEQSEAFTNSVKPALEALYTALEATREATISGVGILTGEAAPEAMGSEEEMPAVDADADPMADIDVDAEVPAEDDGMAAAEPAVGGEEEAGRAKRESVERSRRIGSILSKKK